MKYPAWCIKPAIVIGFVVAAGCARYSTLAPPVVHWGQDVCTNCGMILSDHRFAGAVVFRRAGDDAAETRVFDDVGEMLAWSAPSAAEMRWYAADYDTGRWLNASKAAFVRSETIASPMGTGFAAFLDDRAAKRWRSGTVVLTFDDARRAAVARPYLHAGR